MAEKAKHFKQYKFLKCQKSQLECPEGSECYVILIFEKAQKFRTKQMPEKGQKRNCGMLCKNYDNKSFYIKYAESTKRRKCRLTHVLDPNKL